jgi:hypothetical protein
MTNDTQPVHPVTPVTATPSRRHTSCDGSKWAPTCVNGPCDGCDGYPRTPSHPSPTATRDQDSDPAAQPVTRHTECEERPWGALVGRIASALMSGQGGGGLPLAALSVPTPVSSLYFTVTPVDARGRLADRSPIRALGWQPGQPITITVLQQAVVVTAQPGGADAVTQQGHLRLPARIRHIIHLNTGVRLLVAASPTSGLLVAYTAALLEAILLEHHATTASGRASR